LSLVLSEITKISYYKATLRLKLHSRLSNSRLNPKSLGHQRM